MGASSERAIAWRAALLLGLASGTFSTLVITFGAPRIGRDRAVDWMEIGTVLLGADSVQAEPAWWNIAAGIAVHQAADLSWAIVFFAIARRLTRGLTPVVLLLIGVPWAAVTAAIEYYGILPSLQPLVPMQVPYWTALAVHLTSAAMYPLFPGVRAFVLGARFRDAAGARRTAAVLGAAFAGLIGLELLAVAGREPGWPFASEDQRAFDRAFMRRMAAHHEVGVRLARLAASGAAVPPLRMLGRLMTAGQRAEIEILRRWWRSWEKSGLPPLSLAEQHAVPGVPPPGAIESLGRLEGQAFDHEFIALMIAHHEGAIAMADDAWARAADPRLRVFADSVRHAQRRQVWRMRDLVDELRPNSAASRAEPGASCHKHLLACTLLVRRGAFFDPTSRLCGGAPQLQLVFSQILERC